MGILTPSALWQFEVGVFYADRVGIIFPVLAAMLQIASLAFLVATAFTDPGIVPRQKDTRQQYDARTKCYRTKTPPRTFDLFHRGHALKLKYCITCNIYRPPRCTHCSVCENCVERLDHHCPWIGNCIGKRNYWLFFSFVSTTAVLNILVLMSSALHLALLAIDHRQTDSDENWVAFSAAVEDAPISVALSGYCITIIWFTLGLFMYHNYLICTNQTTVEQIKGVHGNKRSPYYRGVLGNYRDILCGRVRRRYFNPCTGQQLWPKELPEGTISYRPMVTSVPSPSDAQSVLGAAREIDDSMQSGAIRGSSSSSGLYNTLECPING